MDIGREIRVVPVLLRSEEEVESCVRLVIENCVIFKSKGDDRPSVSRLAEFRPFELLFQKNH